MLTPSTGRLIVATPSMMPSINGWLTPLPIKVPASPSHWWRDSFAIVDADGRCEEGEHGLGLGLGLGEGYRGKEDVVMTLGVGGVTDDRATSRSLTASY